MADMYEKRSGKATRQKYEKDRRDKVVQVRMSDAELSLLDERRGTRSRSNFLRGALYGNRHASQSREVVLDVPALDRVRIELNRIGVNVNQQPEDFDPELRSMATSLAMELGRPVRRAELAAQVIRALDRMYAGFPDNKQEYLDKYRADCLTPGNQVQLITPSSRQEARAIAVDDDFRLVVELPDGTRKALSAGEVSVRGMYGYV